MEMCYDGTLVMPSSYIAMDEEEMTYVEGGGTIKLNFSRDFLRDCLTATLSGVTAIVCGIIGTVAGGPLGCIIGGGIGAALGWIIGGSIARSKIKNGATVKIWIPFVKSRTYNIE
ncbi:MAG: hypothetical protein HFH65_08685 [Lachnospiraceae bacterium]|nr:hypothetical protein [Lachnospiraceae bacterium]